MGMREMIDVVAIKEMNTAELIQLAKEYNHMVDLLGSIDDIYMMGESHSEPGTRVDTVITLSTGTRYTGTLRVEMSE